jgi:hypothetical protein
MFWRRRCLKKLHHMGVLSHEDYLDVLEDALMTLEVNQHLVGDDARIMYRDARRLFEVMIERAENVEPAQEASQ